MTCKWVGSRLAGVFWVSLFILEKQEGAAVKIIRRMAESSVLSYVLTA